ncbi:hypothetical protein CRUP_023172, partial [Coryphaenoides rupestris]
MNAASISATTGNAAKSLQQCMLGKAELQNRTEQNRTEWSSFEPPVLNRAELSANTGKSRGRLNSLRFSEVLLLVDGGPEGPGLQVSNRSPRTPRWNAAFSPSPPTTTTNNNNNNVNSSPPPWRCRSPDAREGGRRDAYPCAAAVRVQQTGGPAAEEPHSRFYRPEEIGDVLTTELQITKSKFSSGVLSTAWRGGGGEEEDEEKEEGEEGEEKEGEEEVEDSNLIV